MSYTKYTSYVLHHDLCDQCAFGENGFYNPICCHCKYVTFGKREEPNFTTHEMLEAQTRLINNPCTATEEDLYKVTQTCTSATRVRASSEKSM